MSSSYSVVRYDVLEVVSSSERCLLMEGACCPSLKTDISFVYLVPKDHVTGVFTIYSQFQKDIGLYTCKCMIMIIIYHYKSL